MGRDGFTRDHPGGGVADPIQSTLPDAVVISDTVQRTVPLAQGVIVDGRFRIEEALGEGGMGLVYRATQLSIQRPVALKVLRSELAGDEQMVLRFVHEARSISRLAHPNIVTVLDYGRADAGNLYIVMEYVQGCLLADRIDQEGALAPDRAVHVASQILSALSHAHAHGVIHRDLKPSNVMVLDSGRDECFVKLLDFGVAKLVDDLQSGPSLTRTGFIVGTPKYMAPEQALGEPVDARVDIYAVGVILYEMLTGEPPFQAPAARELLMKQIHETPRPFPREISEVTPARVQDCVARALAKDAANRFQSADEMHDALVGRAETLPARRPATRDNATVTHTLRPRNRTSSIAKGEMLGRDPRGRILAYSAVAVGLTSLAFAIGLVVSKTDSTAPEPVPAARARAADPAPASAPAPTHAPVPASAPALTHAPAAIHAPAPARATPRADARPARTTDPQPEARRIIAPPVARSAKLVVCVTCGGKKCRTDVWLNDGERRASMECAEFATTEGTARVRASRDAFTAETRTVKVTAPATSVKIDLAPIR